MEGLKESRIADIHKMAYITPVNKGGSKPMPKHFITVSLTIHMIKVFKIVIKNPIVEHLNNSDLCHLKVQKFNYWLTTTLMQVRRMDLFF